MVKEQKIDQQALLEEFEKESRTRNFVNPIVEKVVKWVALLVTFYHLAYASGYIRPETLRHRSIHVGMILFMTFAIYPAFKKSSRKKIAWYDYILMLLSIIIPVYMWINYQAIIDRVGNADKVDVIMGSILVLLVIEGARRITGWALPLIGIVFMVYALMGVRQGLIPINVPGVFLHRGFQWTKLIGHLFSNTEGIYGTSVNVASTYIFLFIVFGEVMNKCGMGKFFNDIAIGLAGHTKGGPAKVAVIAAGLLGSINGSAIANVVTTGAFTIPLMKKIGYSKEFSGAVSSTASVGGQLLPPIMGAAAFIMAETLGIKYKEIVISAAIPALIYYLGIIFQIQMRASKDKLDGMSKDQLPNVKETMKVYGHLIIPIVFLVYMLFFSGYTVIKGAFLTILMTIIVAQLKKETRMSLKDLEGAFIASAKSTVSVAIACACVGIVIGVSSLTGFTINMASTIISLGGKSLMLTLVFTMVTCMILGMGLPSIPAYIITVTIAAPALIELGIRPLAAHLFCFYFAMFANITPPVALASFAAAGISGGSPMKTGIVSVKLALAGFIIPYMFVYNNQLLLIDTSLIQGIQVALTACVGVFLISAAVEGFLYTKVNIVMRVIMLAGAFLLIDSSLITDLLGIGTFIITIIVQKTLAKKTCVN
ncbi:MAG: TRAP transporter permease [Fusobacterium gastrosuis]|uniref:TRAP transporter permease n=1 Tax=Fusobacterium gastrosuis TaxID=1755100 RepID=UPI002A9D0AC9|nr:TRAP transporter permease [Fusobacteriaceae bacterium]MDY5795599.1 TRAP transporter permease [Fusobacterium gastrosuis]